MLMLFKKIPHKCDYFYSRFSYMVELLYVQIENKYLFSWKSEYGAELDSEYKEIVNRV